MQITAPSENDIARLAAFLAASERAEGTLTYHEFRGFLFVVATAPVLVRPSEWLPVIFDGEAGYRDLAEAEAITQTIMACYNQTVAASRQTEEIEPADVGVDRGSDQALHEWSVGFATGFEYLEEPWDEVLAGFDADEEEWFEGAFGDLTVWANPEARQQNLGLDDREVRELLDACRELMPMSLARIAEIGITAYEEGLEARSAPATVRSGQVVGRNDPCPCGSGKKFKKCCGVN